MRSGVPLERGERRRVLHGLKALNPRTCAFNGNARVIKLWQIYTSIPTRCSYDGRQIAAVNRPMLASMSVEAG